VSESSVGYAQQLFIAAALAKQGQNGPYLLGILDFGRTAKMADVLFHNLGELLPVKLSSRLLDLLSPAHYASFTTASLLQHGAQRVPQLRLTQILADAVPPASPVLHRDVVNPNHSLPTKVAAQEWIGAADRIQPV
jgi:hypothetical protein